MGFTSPASNDLGRVFRRLHHSTPNTAVTRRNATDIETNNFLPCRTVGTAQADMDATCREHAEHTISQPRRVTGVQRIHVDQDDLNAIIARGILCRSRCARASWRWAKPPAHRVRVRAGGSPTAQLLPIPSGLSLLSVKKDPLTWSFLRHSRHTACVQASTQDQAEDGVGLDTQTAKVQTWAEWNGASEVNTFRDEGISEKRLDNRPGLRTVLNAMDK